MGSKEIIFATSNENKVLEAKMILEPDYLINQYHVDLLEIQDNNIEKIAKYSVQNLSNNENNIFVEDTGLFIEGLNGFPGPYASYCFKTLGNEGIIKLMMGQENRKAYFNSYIAFKSNGIITTFNGMCLGYISKEIRGKYWGYDPIFIPESQFNKDMLTFSELGDESKNIISHRAKAVIEMKKFLDKNSF